MPRPFRNAALALVAVAATAMPAATAEKNDDPMRLAEEGLDKMVRALEAMIRSIPQYEKPEINENGDIIIRRKRPGSPRLSPDPETGKKPERGKSI